MTQKALLLPVFVLPARVIQLQVEMWWKFSAFALHTHKSLLDDFNCNVGSYI